MSPGERDAVVRSGFITEPSEVPADLIARARQRTDAHIEATEATGDQR